MLVGRCVVQVLAPGSPFKPKKGRFHVIYLDFSSLRASGFDVAKASMTRYLAWSAQEQHGIDISDAGADIGETVKLWVHRLNASEQRPVVMLVDEYNHPVVHSLHKPAMAELIASDVLGPFFAATKTLSEYFHKVFVTGVSNIGVSSMLSGANQYKLLLLECPDFCSLYGFTEAELRATYVWQCQCVILARMWWLTAVTRVSCRFEWMDCAVVAMSRRDWYAGTASIVGSPRGSRQTRSRSGVETSRG